MRSTLTRLGCNDLLCASDVLSDFCNLIEFALKIDKFLRRAIENVNAFLFAVDVDRDGCCVRMVGCRRGPVRKLLYPITVLKRKEIDAQEVRNQVAHRRD